VSINDDLWKWIRQAPLPVVLAISLTGFGAMSTWVWAVGNEVAAAKAESAVAAEKAANAERNSRRAEDKMDEANRMLNKLLEAVAAIQATLAERDKAKK
jgi:hypothetical protein